MVSKEQSIVSTVDGWYVNIVCVGFGILDYLNVID
jgi:hypothetical protein